MEDFRSSSSHYNSVDAWPPDDTTCTPSVSELTERTNWTTTTTSSENSALHDCGPSEYMFLFYAYYYGFMSIVTLIGVAGNTAVIR